MISSDRGPKRLVTLEDRLRSRFAILRRKAIQEGLNAPPEVAEYIASRISASIMGQTASYFGLFIRGPVRGVPVAAARHCPVHRRVSVRPRHRHQRLQISVLFWLPITPLSSKPTKAIIRL